MVQPLKLLVCGAIIFVVSDENESGSSFADSSSSDEDGDSGVEDYPLPDPLWGHRASTAMTFDNVNEYERFVQLLRPLLQDQLLEHPYNTVGSFVRFYESFKNQSKLALASYFRAYSPPITPEHHTCVGLSLDLLDRVRQSSSLRSHFPSVLKHVQLSSCEEDYDENVHEYTLFSPPETEQAFKEHVVVSLKISIGERAGVVILDPGYHVSIPVTVMEDRRYPHTAWFTLTKSSKVEREYNYELTADRKYVLWNSRETRAGLVKHKPPSIIYVHRNFVNCVDLVERRNLVYLFKVWVARDLEGQLTAGLHFSVVRRGVFATFYRNENGERVDCKIPFSYFLDEEEKGLNVNFENAVENVERQLGKSCPSGGLRSILWKVARIVEDQEFLSETIKINEIMEA